MVDAAATEEFMENTELELGHEVTTVLLDVVVLFMGILHGFAAELIPGTISAVLNERIDILTYQLS